MKVDSSLRYTAPDGGEVLIAAVGARRKTEKKITRKRYGEKKRKHNERTAERARGAAARAGGTSLEIEPLQVGDRVAACGDVDIADSGELGPGPYHR